MARAKGGGSPRVDTKYIKFEGGLDTETGKYEVASGTVRESKNVYQRINGGYRVIGGYERFSGKPKPSSAVYYTLNITLTGAIAVGDTVTDLDASGSAVVIANMTTYLVLTKLTGTWNVHGGEVMVAGVQQATMTAIPSPLSALTRLLDAQYKHLAANEYRGDIAPPVGSGAVLGIWLYKDDWYSFRDVFSTDGGSIWSIRTTPVDNSWSAVCWSPELGLFCAVSSSGGVDDRVMTSPDGITWTIRESAAGNQWRSVCWSPELGLFCAFASSGTLNRAMTSPDGIVWTARTTEDKLWQSVCWSPELGLFCAVARDSTGNTVATSPDGVTWTGRTPSIYNQWYSVTWSSSLGLFCAVAASGTGTRVMTSSDGINWTTRTSAADNFWVAVCWSPELGLFCAVGPSGTGDRVMTSPDGITWTTQASAVDNWWYGVCWSSELNLFCAVSSNGTGNRVMTSPDGITWTTQASAADNGWFGVTSGAGVLCAVASTGVGNRAMTSGESGVRMYKSLTGGWTQVPLGSRLNFTSGGTYQIQDGDIVVGEISGATAVVGRVVKNTGSWVGGTAAGFLVFQAQTGSFQAETIRVGSNLNAATITGDSSAITIPNVGGRYEFVNGNFTGSADTEKMYGCDGRNDGFEFDGINYVPIETGITTAYPTHVEIHKQQLFFSFLGSAQHSQPGLPYEWTLVLGSGEIGLGDVITGFIPQVGSEGNAAMAIFSAREVSILYGSNITDWNLVPFNQKLGAIEWTPQRIGETVFVDHRGITKLSASQAFGNFADSTMSILFDSYIDSKKTQIVASAVSREKNLYMLFFNDKTAMFCTMVGGKLRAAMEQELNHRVTCICSGEYSNGGEAIMFGTDDGYVYELFSGTSFDGDPKSWFFYTAHDHLGSPTYLKRFMISQLDAKADGYASFQLGFSLEFESRNTPQPSLVTREITLDEVFWGDFYWGNFYWDGQSLSPEKFPTMGLSSNIGYKLAGSSEYDAELTFHGVLLQYYMTRSTR